MNPLLFGLMAAVVAGASGAATFLLRKTFIALVKRAVRELAQEINPTPPAHGLVVGRVVIVNIKGRVTGALVGVLVAVTGTASDGTIVLANARTLPGREKILGEAVVPRDQIDWLQSDVPPSLLEDVTE